MRKKDKTTVQTADVIELQKEVHALRGKISLIRIGRFTKPSKNVREAKGLRNRLAVILTVLRQKELNNG